MKKLVLLCVIPILFTACSNKNDVEKPVSNIESSQNAENTENTILYSNLIDSDSQKEVFGILEKNGVSKQQIETLMAWIEDFNSRINPLNLAEGFNTMQEGKVDFSNLSVDIKETGEGEILPEVNCRLNSYLLIKNILETNKKQIDNDTFLMFDLEAIDTQEQFRLSDEERANFVSLFNWVPVNDAKTLEEHIDRIEKAWEDREIKINSDKISIVNVYLHSTFEDIRFVGHTGILIELEDNELLFFEKYGPMYPFQANKFNNRKELKEYLLARPDLYGDETELPPIIMENNKLMD